MPQLSILSRRNGVTKILCGDCPNQRRLTLFPAAESVDQTGSFDRGECYQSSTLPGHFWLD
jgi:hypothetical protein